MGLTYMYKFKIYQKFLCVQRNLMKSQKNSTSNINQFLKKYIVLHMKTMSKEFSNFYYFYVYSIDYKTEENTYIFCGIESIKDEKLLIPEFIKLKNISWKSLYNLMNKTRNIWRMKHFNNELTLEFQSLSQFIFSKLKSCQENLNLREKNLVLENDINTEFQTILYDFLYDEQELYAYYDELFKQKLGEVSIKELSRTAKERRAGSLGYAEAMINIYNKRSKYPLNIRDIYSTKPQNLTEEEKQAANL